MKLYATVQSERATKGQGGNQRLDIQLTVGDSDKPLKAGVVALREIEPNIFVVTYFHDGVGIPLARIEG